MKNHIPVMLEEVINYLNIKNTGTYIDCTLGGGGHSQKIIENLSDKGKLFCLDWDISAIENANVKFGKYRNIFILNENFANLEEIVKKYKIRNIKGILLDLGFSSLQIEDGNRGFSFNYEASLDMRYDTKGLQTAEYILNNYSELELSNILRDYADERFAGNIAKSICLIRKIERIKTTKDLVDIIRKSTPKWYQHRRVHFATKTFQAIRIATNNEMENIKKGILSAIKVASKGAIIVVISFHSIEHRMLKNIFKETEKNNIIRLIEKKPVFPTYKEIMNNPRARSAQMRIIEKI